MIVTLILLGAYLWAIGAWGFWDIYTIDGESDWITAAICILWPLMLPLSGVVSCGEWVAAWYRGYAR